MFADLLAPWGSLKRLCRVAQLDDTLVAMRLRLAARLTRGPNISLAIIQADAGSRWRVTLHHNLERFLSVMGKRFSGFFAGAFQPWFQLWEQYPAEWKRMIRLFLSKVAQDKTRAQQKEQEEDESDKSEADHLCGMCGRTFFTKVGLSTHQRQAHAVRAVERDYVTGSQCPICEVEFHSRLRVLRHLKKVPACRESILAGEVPQCDPEAIARADAADAEEMRLAKRAGLNVLAGPPVRRQGGSAE